MNLISRTRRIICLARQNLLLFVTAVVLTSLLPSVVFARCQEGASSSEKRPDGSTCTRMCVDGRWVKECTAPKEPEEFGQIRPNYLILTVIYTPPGRQGAESESFVDYHSGSGTGTVVSGSHTFKDGYGVSVEVGIGKEGIGSANTSGSFNFTRSGADSASTALSKDATSQILLKGPSVDGIDHNFDQIYLLLSPVLRAKATSTGFVWGLAPDKPAVSLPLTVSWLLNPSSMPGGVKDALVGSGILESEYAKILAADPYASAKPPVDPDRYLAANIWLPYLPGHSFSGLAVHNENVTKTGTAKTTDITVGAHIDGSANFLTFWHAKSTADASWTWSTTSDTEDSTTLTQTAAVTIGPASDAYAGPVFMAVYYDTLYRSFLFIPESKAPQFSGRLISGGSARAVISGIRVSIVLNGKTYTTYTDKDGVYRFPPFGTGTGRISFAGLPAKSVSIGPNRRFDLRVP